MFYRALGVVLGVALLASPSLAVSVSGTNLSGYAGSLYQFDTTSSFTPTAASPVIIKGFVDLSAASPNTAIMIGLIDKQAYNNFKWWTGGVQAYFRKDSGTTPKYSVGFCDVYRQNGDYVNNADWLQKATNVSHMDFTMMVDDRNVTLTVDGLGTQHWDYTPSLATYGTSYVDYPNELANGSYLYAIGYKPNGISFQATVVPEPLTMLSVFGAVAGIGAYIRKRRVA